MPKKLLILAATTLTLFAKFSATPSMQCEAYNNMRHTKNTHHITLDTSKKYTILKKHKGQFLVLIPGESIAQRWVVPSCFSKNVKTHKSPNISKHTNKYKTSIFNNKNNKNQTLLVLSWQNAFCQMHRRVTECKRFDRSDKGHLTLHGLWPQPRSNQYCKVPHKLVAKDKHHQWRALPNIDIEPQTLELMDRYMPGYVSRLHKHEWIKHGTCYGKSADGYFHDALTLAKEVDNSAVGDLMRKNVGKKLTLSQIKAAFDRAFGKGASEHVAISCSGGLITEIKVALSGHSDEIKDLIFNGSHPKSRCQQGKVDRTGY